LLGKEELLGALVGTSIEAIMSCPGLEGVDTMARLVGMLILGVARRDFEIEGRCNA
jgi:hypothetical protein